MQLDYPPLNYPPQPGYPPQPKPRWLAALPRIRFQAPGIGLEAGGIGSQASLIERGPRGRRLHAVGQRCQAVGPGRVGEEPGHGEREQLVQGCPLPRGEGLEQVILDSCELGVGLRELVRMTNVAADVMLDDLAWWSAALEKARGRRAVPGLVPAAGSASSPAVGQPADSPPAGPRRVQPGERTRTRSSSGTISAPQWRPPSPPCCWSGQPDANGEPRPSSQSASVSELR
jgi:hypothetical protein